MKKWSTSLLGICAVGTLVLIAVPHFTAWARETQAAVNVSSTPIDRDARSGNSYSSVVKKAAPSVVNIYSARFVKQRLYRNPMMADPFFRQFFGGQVQEDSREITSRENWLGSGIIVTADGYILTANHVVEGADEIKVGISNDKTSYSARIIGTDPATDIAVLKISAKDLPAITLGDSTNLEVGDVVLAIGNPFGLGQTVTRGIISALGRSLPEMENPGMQRIRQYQDFIQTDASINKGNSGGALVDSEGRLIGINDAIVSPSGTSAGIGFAVPVNMARNVMERLISGGRVTRGYLGIMPQNVDGGLAQQFNLPNQNGAFIGFIQPNSPAQKAGLQDGDVILSVNDKDIADAHQLQLTISELSPRTKATLKIIRNGMEKTIIATLGESPDQKNTPENLDGDAMPEINKADMLDGVSVADLDDNVRQQIHAPATLLGAFVTDVGQDSNAAEAGLRPNDVILEVNRQPVKNSEDAVRLGKASRSNQIVVKIWRRIGNSVGTRYLSVDNTKHAK